MGQLSTTSIYKALVSFFSSLDTADEALIRNTLIANDITGSFTDGGTAATAQTETAVWVNDTGVSVRLQSVKIVTPVAVAANGTNFGTVTVAYRNSAGGGAVTVGTQATSAVSLTAFAPQAVTITAGNDTVPAGGVVTVALAKSGTGVAFAAATSQAYVKLQYVPAI